MMPAYKDKERGTWYASFYYTDWRGDRKLKKSADFPERRDAEEYEREFLRKEAQSCDMTFRLHDETVYGRYAAASA